jgi:hypothetical protein
LLCWLASLSPIVPDAELTHWEKAAIEMANVIVIMMMAINCVRLSLNSFMPFHLSRDVSLADVLCNVCASMTVNFPETSCVVGNLLFCGEFGRAARKVLIEADVYGSQNVSRFGTV